MFKPTDTERHQATTAATNAAGGEVVSVVPLAGGEVHTVIRVTTTTADLVVRIERTAPPDWHPPQDGELAAMHLASVAGVAVPEVVAAEPGLVVFRYVDGRPASEVELDQQLVCRIGHAFGRLHATSGEGLGPVQPDGSAADWPAGTFTQSVTSEAESLSGLEDRLDLERVDAAVDHIFELQPTMRSRLVHGDASPSNVIVDGDSSVTVIDFEASWFADPAIDLAWWWWNSPTTADAFQAACAEVSEPTDDCRLWVHRARLLIGLASTFAAGDLTRARRIDAQLGEAVTQLRQLS